VTQAILCQGLLASRMTRLAERDQVLQLVRRAPVAIEQAARHDVVDVEPWPALALPAVLARVVVALSGTLGLRIPVWPIQGLAATSVASAFGWVLANVFVPACRATEPPLIAVGARPFAPDLDRPVALPALLDDQRFAKRRNRLSLPRRRDTRALLRRPDLPGHFGTADATGVVTGPRTELASAARVVEITRVHVEGSAADSAGTRFTTPAPNVSAFTGAPTRRAAQKLGDEYLEGFATQLAYAYRALSPADVATVMFFNQLSASSTKCRRLLLKLSPASCTRNRRLCHAYIIADGSQ
jgi:hypothetical protein